MPTDYTDQQQIEAYRSRQLNSNEARIAKTLIGAVSRWIDQTTGFKWYSGADAEERYYDGGGEYVFIDPCQAIEGVEYINLTGDITTTYDSSQYQAFPLNEPTKTYLKLLWLRRWPRGEGRIKVTGKFGEDGGVPDDIQLAATILACDWLSNEDNLKSEIIEGYKREFADTADHNPQVDAILAARKRILL